MPDTEKMNSSADAAAVGRPEISAGDGGRAGGRGNWAEAFAWTATGPLAAALWVVIFVIAPLVAGSHPPAPHVELFCHGALSQLAPKPLERTRVMLAMGVIPLLSGVWALGWRAKRVRGAVGRLGARGIAILAVGSQIALIAFVVAMWVYQDAYVYHFLSYLGFVFGAGIAAVAIIGMWLAGGRKTRFAGRSSAGFAASGALAASGGSADSASSGTISTSGASADAVPSADSLPSAAVVATGAAPSRSRYIASLVFAAAFAVALAYTIFRVSPLFIPTAQWPNAPQFTRMHLSSTSEEFAAVVNGQTILVDSFPQYQNLTPYLLEPVFRIVGFNWTTFSGAMAALSVIGLMLQFDVFRRISGGPGKALILFIPFVAFSAQVTLASAYYQVGPLRYVGPWVVSFFLAIALERPSAVRQIALFFLAGLAAINNLDFGMPALVAAGVAVLLTGERGIAPDVRRWPGTIGAFVLGAGLALAGFCVFTWVRSHQWPDFSRVAMIQKAVVVEGLLLLPMPAGGFQWVVYVTHISAIFVGLMDLADGDPSGVESSVQSSVESSAAEFTRARNDSRAAERKRWASMPTLHEANESMATRMIRGTQARRLLAGMLIFAGLSGLGALLYYCGRSHPLNMPRVLPAWAFTLMLLTWRGFADAIAWLPGRVVDRLLDRRHALRGLPRGKPSEQARCARRPPGDALLHRPLNVAAVRWLPMTAVGLAYLLCLGYVFIPDGKDPNPEDARLKTGIDAYYKYSPRLRQWFSPGEPAMIYMFFGHQMAMENGVKNVDPFTQDSNLLGQLDMEMDAIKKSGAVRALGRFQEEMELKLFDAGFTIRWSDPDDGATLWEKTGNPNDAASNHRKAVDLNTIGQWPAAQADFERSIAQDPRIAATHADYASALYDHGDARRAIEQFRAAVALAPDDADSQYNLGILLLTNGRAEEAVAPLTAASRLRPGDQAAMEALRMAVAPGQNPQSK